MRPCGHRTKDESWASGRAHSESGSEWGQSWNKTREERSRLMSWAARGQGCLYWRLSWVGRHSLADICQKVRVCSLTPTRHRNLQGVQLKNFNIQHFPAVQGINPWVTEWWGFLGHPWERPGSGWWFFHCLLCPTLYIPMDCSTPGFPVLHHLPELAQTHVHWVGDAIQPSSLVLCHSLLLLPFIFPSIRVFFQWVGSWHQVAKVLKLQLQLQHQSFQWIFKVDFF